MHLRTKNTSNTQKRRNYPLRGTSGSQKA